MSKRFALGVILLSAVAANSTWAGWDEGVAAFNAKNYEKAVTEFKAVVDQNPGGHRGHYMLGASLQRLGRKEEALGHLRKAYDLNPNDVATKFELGKAYLAVRKYREVTELMANTDVSAMQPAQKAAFYQIRGEAYLRTDNVDAAMADFSNLAKAMPKDSNVQYSLATVALKADQLDVALAALSEAVRLDPADKDKKKAYANALLKQGRSTPDKEAKKQAYRKAAEVAGQMVAADPSFDNLMLKMSAELGAGSYAEAARTGEAARAKNSKDWLVLFYLGQSYTMSDQFDKSVAPLQEALKLAPEADKKKIHQQLGFNYERQKKYPEAIAAYKAAGDSSAVARVETNQKTALENLDIEKRNAEVEELARKQRELDEAIKAAQKGGGR